MGTVVSRPYVAEGAAAAMGKRVESSNKPDGMGTDAVLRASHPELMKGSEAVNAETNPNGQRGTSGRKERVLRDLTNKMDMGSSSLKPTHNGLCSGVDTGKEKAVDLAGGAIEDGAQVNILRVVEAGMGVSNGPGLNERPHSTYPPDLVSRGDKIEVFGIHRFIQIADGGGQSGGKREAPAERQ